MDSKDKDGKGWTVRIRMAKDGQVVIRMAKDGQ